LVNVGLPATASSNQNAQCQGALSKESSQSEEPSFFQVESGSKVMDEMVELTLRPRTQGAASSPWHEISVQGQRADKVAEIERTLGPAAALKFFTQVRARVMRRILGLDATAHGDSPRSQSVDSQKSKKVKVFRTERVKSFVGHSGWINPAVFSPDGKMIAKGSKDGTSKLWDAETGQVVHTLDGPTTQGRDIVFSPDGSQFLMPNLKTAELWSLYSVLEIAGDGQDILSKDGELHQ
jgi:hypothetical protein